MTWLVVVAVLAVAFVFGSDVFTPAAIGAVVGGASGVLWRLTKPRR